MIFSNLGSTTNLKIIIILVPPSEGGWGKKFESNFCPPGQIGLRGGASGANRCYVLANLGVGGQNIVDIDKNNQDLNFIVGKSGGLNFVSWRILEA